MCETEGAHITGKQPYILEDFTREDAILTRPPPPCSRAQRAAEPPTAARHTLQTKYACVIEDLQHHQYGNQHSPNKVAECIGYECCVKGFLERVFFLEDKMIRQQLNQNRENHCREIVNNQTQ